MKTLSDIINNALKGIINIFPQIADFEDAENLPYPFAVYRIDETGAQTKGGERRKQYTVSIALVCESYDNIVTLGETIKAAILALRSTDMAINYGTTTTDYDEEDRAYMANLIFSVKMFNNQ